MKKSLVNVPLLSLATLIQSATNIITKPQKPVSVKTVVFLRTASPNTAQERSKLHHEASAVVTFSDGSRKAIHLEYKSLFNPREIINGKISGTKYSAHEKMVFV